MTFLDAFFFLVALRVKKHLTYSVDLWIEFMICYVSKL